MQVALWAITIHVKFWRVADCMSPIAMVHTPLGQAQLVYQPNKGHEVIALSPTDSWSKDTQEVQ